MKTADLYIVNEISKSKISASYVQDFLIANKGADKIVVHIDSEGGSVYEGYSIYNLLKNSGKKIETNIINFCGSIATIIALAGDDVYMSDVGRFMIHNPFASPQGDSKALRNAANELDTIKDELINIYASKTGKDISTISALMDEEKRFTAEEAKDFGFITEKKEPSTAVAFIENKTNFINMDKKEFDASLSEKFSNFAKELKNALIPKNEVEKVILTTGEGVEFDIWVDALEGEDLIGREVKKIVGGEPVEEGYRRWFL